MKIGTASVPVPPRRHRLWTSRQGERTLSVAVTDPQASAETLWAVRKTVARARRVMTSQERTLRQLLVIARAKAEEVFDRVYGVVRMRKAGVDLDQHPDRCTECSCGWQPG